MKPTQTLILQLEDKLRKPLNLAGVYFDLFFFMNERFCYAFRFGPTDHQGKLRITYQDVEIERALEAKFNLMDYNTPLDDCDDILKIKIPSVDELKKAYEWQAKWLDGGASAKANSWLHAANSKIKSDEISVELKRAETVVSIQCLTIEP